MRANGRVEHRRRPSRRDVVQEASTAKRARPVGPAQGRIEATDLQTEGMDLRARSKVYQPGIALEAGNVLQLPLSRKPPRVPGHPAHQSTRTGVTQKPNQFQSRASRLLGQSHLLAPDCAVACWSQKAFPFLRSGRIQEMQEAVRTPRGPCSPEQLQVGPLPAVGAPQTGVRTSLPSQSACVLHLVTPGTLSASGEVDGPCPAPMAPAEVPCL
mmetsp:Transcript_107507/g.229550  ORF Transcript_107507/g.229550 Transcript_107507/m.229550 type:complete len:213 (-) Transcript_107507:1240-1878(-)